MIYIPVRLVGTWDIENYYKLFNHVSIFSLCKKQLSSLLKIAVFVRLTSTVLRSLRVYYNLLRTLLLLLSILLWILSCRYLYLHVVMMLFLVSLIASVEYVCSSRSRPLLVHLMLLMSFLKSGFASMVYHKKLLVIVMLDLQVSFGNNCLSF